MTDPRIVATAYRYKRPPKKRTALAIAGPAVVRKRAPKFPSVGNSSEQPTNDDRKPAIATSISRKRTKFLRTEQATEPEPDDDLEADAAMRGWLERAKWGHGPAR